MAVAGALLLVASVGVVLITSIPVVPNLYHVGLLAFPVVGALLARHRPGNLVGRLLTATGAAMGVGSFSTVVTWAAIEGHDVVAADLAAWVATWAYMPVTLLLPLLVAVFPTGRVGSAWLRRCLWVAGIPIVAMSLLYAVAPLPVNEILFDRTVVNPWAVESLTGLAPYDEASTYLVLGLLTVTVADLVVRLRRSRGQERLQLRWAAFGLSICALLFAAAVTAELAGGGSTWLWVATFGIGFTSLPVAVGVAVARYRLYAIDRLVSRSVTYALVLGALAGVYAGGVLLLGWILPLQGELGVAGSTLAVAALFAPLRRRLRTAVDRRFDRARYDAALVVDEFGTKLRDEVDLETIRHDVVDVVGRAVQPTAIAVWLRPEGT